MTSSVRAADGAASANASRVADSSSVRSLPSTRTSACSLTAPAVARTVSSPLASSGAATRPSVAPVHVSCGVATGVSWSSIALTFSVRCRPGKTRGSDGVITSSSATPLPGFTKTPTPFGSKRSEPSDGRLRIVTFALAQRAGDHRRRAAAVEVQRGLRAEVGHEAGQPAQRDAEDGVLAAVGGDQQERASRRP